MVPSRRKHQLVDFSKDVTSLATLAMVTFKKIQDAQLHNACHNRIYGVAYFVLKKRSLHKISRGINVGLMALVMWLLDEPNTSA